MFSDPDKNIQQFSVGEGWRLGDFGAGSGAYSFAAAEQVGSDGHVYAIDVNEGLLSKISNEARERHLGVIEVVRGDVEVLGGTNLRDLSLDGAVAANIFFQVESKQGLLDEIKRTLRGGGRVLVVDWKSSFGGLGPHPDHIAQEEEIKDLFLNNGFTFERSIDAGAQHYGLIFKKK